MSTLVDLIHGRVLASTRGDPSSGLLPGPVELAAAVRAFDPLLPAAAVSATVGAVQARMTGLGPLEPLLADPAVTDVLVNGPGPVWVERFGHLERSDVVLDRSTIDLLAERIVAPLGRRVDPSSPVVDGRLPDGSRVHVVVPPLAVDGPCIAIRRFATRPIPLGAIATPPVAELLEWAVRARANILVVGATGSGKTTLLNALGQAIPPGERIITVEDAAELRLASDHVVRLESRPPSADGATEITVRDLVRNALRMRPDRLVVGEVRGPEAVDMVAAMNTGHDGSLSTLHANGCEDALRRLEALMLSAGTGLPLDAVREHIASALDLVVHVARRHDGTRRVIEVAEVVEAADPDPTTWTSVPEVGAVRPVGVRSGAWRHRTRLVADVEDRRGRLVRVVREPAAGPPPELRS